jgi:hypothetical protein
MITVLFQRGENVAGVVRLKSGLRGPLSGRVQGNQGSFSLTLDDPECPIKLTGTGSVSPTTIEGKFQGHDCKRQPVQGSFRFAL